MKKSPHPKQQAPPAPSLHEDEKVIKVSINYMTYTITTYLRCSQSVCMYVSHKTSNLHIYLRQFCSLLYKYFFLPKFIKKKYSLKNANTNHYERQHGSQSIRVKRKTNSSDQPKPAKRQGHTHGHAWTRMHVHARTHQQARIKKKKSAPASHAEPLVVLDYVLLLCWTRQRNCRTKVSCPHIYTI